MNYSIDWDGPGEVDVMECYSDLEMDLGQKIYEDRYASEGGVWRAVETRDVWYNKARELIQFIENYPVT